MPKDYPQKTYFALRMRGLPYNIQRSDILKFFEGHDIKPESIKLGVNFKKVGTGFAVLQFKDMESMLGAYKKKQGGFIKNRWIELFVIDETTYRIFEKT